MMKLTNQRLLLAVLGCLSLPCLLASAQATDRDQNLSACKNGWGSCDRSVLTQPEAMEVAAAVDPPNHSDFRDSWEACDYAKLTQADASALCLLSHEPNFYQRMRRWSTCEHSHYNHE